MSLALGRPAKPLEPASRQSVEDALSALRAVLKHLEAHFLKSTTDHELSPLSGDAEGTTAAPPVRA